MKSILYRVKIRNVGDLYVGGVEISDIERAAKVVWKEIFPDTVESEFMILSIERVGEWLLMGWLKDN